MHPNTLAGESSLAKGKARARSIHRGVSQVHKGGRDWSDASLVAQMEATRRETLGWRRRGILLATAVGLPATRNISSYVSVVIVIIA
jgi:hypothetical protein